MNRSHIASTCVAFAIALATSSCIINANSHTTRSGRFVSAETLAQIQPGKSKEYVATVLGEPSSKNELSDGTGTEIWKWTWREKRSSSGAVFLIIDSDHSTEEERSTYVEFLNGVVSKSWQD